MKKYKMRIKKGITEHNGYNLSPNVKIPNVTVWLYRFGNDSFAHNVICVGGDEFAMEEIEKMSYGFVKQYDLIEAKEQLYYIKFPYLKKGSNYLNEFQNSPLTGVMGSYENFSVKTKFTKQEIEEKYPLYANEHFMVKAEDDE